MVPGEVTTWSWAYGPLTRNLMELGVTIIIIMSLTLFAKVSYEFINEKYCISICDNATIVFAYF